MKLLFQEELWQIGTDWDETLQGGLGSSATLPSLTSACTADIQLRMTAAFLVYKSKYVLL